MNRNDIARAICCPDTVCASPEKCRKNDRTLVDIRKAVLAVEALQRQLVQRVYQGGPIQPLSGDAE